LDPPNFWAGYATGFIERLLRPPKGAWELHSTFRKVVSIS